MRIEPAIVVGQLQKDPSEEAVAMSSKQPALCSEKCWTDCYSAAHMYTPNTAAAHQQKVRPEQQAGKKHHINMRMSLLTSPN